MALELRYKPVRGTLVLRILGCLALLGIAVWAATGEAWDGIQHLAWSTTLIICGGYLGFVAVGYARQLFNPDSLCLDAQGFSFWVVWRRKRFAWTEVSPFRVAPYRMLKVIAFDYSHAKDNFRTRMVRDVVGVSDIIVAHSFNAPMEQVCAKLNEFRVRALGS